MEALGWAMAVIIGVSLGLLGGGGSILTVPVLVYLLGVEPVLATGYSLFIVGASSLMGAFSYFRKQLVDWKTALIFGMPSVASVYLTRMFIVPVIPDELITLQNFEITKSMAVMLLFATMMVAASYSMIRKTKPTDSTGERKFNYPMIFVEGTVVGMLTGLVGAGGGFLIIPALVVLSKLPMKMAVGTSLVIIAAKSLIGFIGDVQNQAIDWTFLLGFSALAGIGIFIGSKLSEKIEGNKLKPAFGWFVLVMGFYILGKELFFN
jgi:hypothetical protein